MIKLDYINSIRGLAILGVLLVHCNQYGNSIITGALGEIINSGQRGVQLFFIASAFTLFLSYNNRYPVEDYPIKKFFIRRFFRIAPMYYLGIRFFSFTSQTNYQFLV